jgi:lipid II:glycine glycyltransferase (peptidoglycan interpeptide bridge formation enzyme)
MGAGVFVELKIGKVLYFPYGPVFLDNVSKESINLAKEKIRKVAKENKCVFVRMENSVLGGFKPVKKTYASEGIFQPRVEWWKDVTQTQEEIYESFGKNHRYSVRKFEKEKGNIEIIENNFYGELDKIYSLMEETSKRDEFINHEREYVGSILKSLDDQAFKGFVIYSKVEDKINGFALVLIYDKVANYLLGGSTTEGRSSGSSVYLLYKAMLQSKKYLAEVFNFGGITEGGYGRTSLEGVTNFKKQFGGGTKFHGGFFDYPIDAAKYFLYVIKKMIY